MIPSRPVYAPLQLDPFGLRHLLVCDRGEAPDLDGATVERWTVSNDSRSAQGEGPHIVFRAAPQLLERLTYRLAEERVGLRLYAAGDEAFLWDVAALAEAAGMSAEEYALTRLGGASRRVHCIHCSTMIENVATTIATCPGCAAPLLVRDHFSKRLRAFMGVQIDAEAPGEHDAPEALPS
jgi:hypothetical protein